MAAIRGAVAPSSWSELSDNRAMPDEIDFDAEGLLAGLDPPAREARLRLLAELYAEGVPVEELRTAIEQDRLALLAVELVWAGGLDYTLEEVAAAAGVSAGLVMRSRRALGLAFADDGSRQFGAADIDTARRLGELIAAGLSEPGVLEVGRVIGMAMSQIAAASRGLAGEALVRPGDSEFEVSQRLALATETLTPVMGPILVHAFQLHVREQLKRDAISRNRLEHGPSSAANFRPTARKPAFGQRLSTPNRRSACT